MFVYLSVSSISTVAQVLILQQNGVRKLLDLPIVDPGIAPKKGGMLETKPLSLQEAVKALKNHK